MKIFKKANWYVPGTKSCPICGTKKEGAVVLIGISGTEEDNTVEARQVHLECLDLMIVNTMNAAKPKSRIIYQTFEEKGE